MCPVERERGGGLGRGHKGARGELIAHFLPRAVPTAPRPRPGWSCCCPWAASRTCSQSPLLPPPWAAPALPQGPCSFTSPLPTPRAQSHPNGPTQTSTYLPSLHPFPPQARRRHSRAVTRSGDCGTPQVCRVATPRVCPLLARAGGMRTRPVELLTRPGWLVTLNLNLCTSPPSSFCSTISSSGFGNGSLGQPQILLGSSGPSYGLSGRPVPLQGALGPAIPVPSSNIKPKAGRPGESPPCQGAQHCGVACCPAAHLTAPRPPPAPPRAAV